MKAEENLSHFRCTLQIFILPSALFVTQWRQFVNKHRLDASVSNASSNKSREYVQILRDSGDSTYTDLDNLDTRRHMTFWHSIHALFHTLPLSVHSSFLK